MEQLIMMTNKKSKFKIKNKIMNEPNNLFISWNKDDKICIPLKIKKPMNFSSKKVTTSFPKLEEVRRSSKRLSNSFKLIQPKENSMFNKKKNVESEQTKVNTILPKIRLNNLAIIKNNNIGLENGMKKKTISYLNDNDMNKNNKNYTYKNTFEKKIIKNFYALSQAGKNNYGVTKVNQDSYLVLTKINNLFNFNVFAIFDGHGVNGHIVSQFLVQYFTDFFKNNSEIKKCKTELEIFNLLLHLNYQLIRDAITASEEKLKEQKNFNIEFSGSTCCMLIQAYQKIICVNIGDSRAILFSIMIKEEITNLSFDHKPNLKKELERIKKYGGVVEKCLYEDGVTYGPFRVWNSSKQEYPGLAVSRSIGDSEATKLGVLAEPDFNLKTLKNHMKFIVIASDGIWEYLNNKNVCEIIKPFYLTGDAKGAAEELINQSREKWAKKGDSADDTSVIVIFF